jgi:4-hydroxy-tetrahydrodipicolinate synthase
MKCTFEGSYVALPTPFQRGEPDLAALGSLIEFHVSHGSDGLVVCGTSGEAATLTDYERRTVIEKVVELARGRLPVIAGVGTNATRQSIELTRFATQAGVDGLLAVTPYYNKPSPRGMLLHYGALAEASPLPLVLYNVPSRTGVDLKCETVLELRRRHANIVAIKEASGSVSRARQIRESSDIALIVGEDGLIAELVGIGAIGVIGVVANVAPREVAELVRVAGPGGDPARTAELTHYLHPLVRDLFIESNPAPLKAALGAMNMCSPELRPPLAALEEEHERQLRATLMEAGLIDGRRVPS